MKILVIGIKWPAETFIQRLLAGLSAAGQEITVVSRQKPDAQSGLKWLHPRFLRFYDIKKWDILYFPWNSAAIEHLDFFDAGVPVVMSCRGAQINIAPHNPERKIAEGLRETFQKAARVHCVSDAILKEALQFGLDAQKAAVINPAVSTDFFRPETKKSDGAALKIISTGSLIWRKGYEYALTAARKVLDQGINVTYTIIGEGPDRERILYTAEDLCLGEHVRLKGNLSPGQIREELNASDIFLLSSLSEGISNAVLEGMACGLPVVTADCGGMREAVSHEKEGLVVPVRDSKALAAAISKLASDIPLRKKMGAAARIKAEEKFDLKTQIEAFTKLFNEAKGKKSCAA